MLNWIEVGAVRRPFHDVVSLLLKGLLDDGGMMDLGCCPA